MSDAAFWNRIADKYAKDKITDLDAYAETLGRMRDILQPDHRVLEIGCGTGSTALELAPGVDSYVGTDVSSEMIKIARAKLNTDLPANISFETASAEEFPNGTFDAILALNLLHLLPNLEGVLRAIHTALPPNGLFIAKTGLIKDGSWILRPMIPIMRCIGKAPFVRNLSKPELLELLTDAGFEVIEELSQPGIAPRHFTVARKIA